MSLLSTGTTTVRAGGWPQASERVRELFRTGAELTLAHPDEVVAQISAATIEGMRLETLHADAELLEAARVASADHLRTWAAANVRAPGERVEVPELAPAAMAVARDVVRRGLDEHSLDSFRTSQNAAWRAWMGLCFALTPDHAELQELLDVSALSITTFMDDLMVAITSRIRAERDALTRGTHAERMATVTLLLEGAPIARQVAEAQLGHSLLGPHTAAVLWGTGEADEGLASRLETAAAALQEAAGTSRRLTVIAGARTMWVWLPTSTRPDPVRLAAALAAVPDVRLALGRAAEGVVGFRRSHIDATTTQRLVGRLAGARQATHHEDVQLVALASADSVRSDEFVADTLGAFEHAPAEDRDAVLAWIRSQCNTTEAARRLYTHRNSVIRRLARADELLPRPLADRVLEVGVALELLRLRGHD